VAGEAISLTQSGATKLRFVRLTLALSPKEGVRVRQAVTKENEQEKKQVERDKRPTRSGKDSGEGSDKPGPGSVEVTSLYPSQTPVIPWPFFRSGRTGR